VRYSFPLGTFREVKLRLRVGSWRSLHGIDGGSSITILLISLSAAQYNLAIDWAEEAQKSFCAAARFCARDSIVGHGRWRKQLMMNIMIGSGFAVVFVAGAATDTI
jgi:hypothetical protein